MRVLILGAGGMLGYCLYRQLSLAPGLQVDGTLRSPLPPGCPRASGTLHESVDVRNAQVLQPLLQRLRPDVLINCIGLIKQLAVSNEPQAAIEINALLPHRLAQLCSTLGAKLIHFSTDCVFLGNRGGYRETDRADADDLYGRSKRLGEIDYGGHLTLRTSIIGHELNHPVSLVDWFLAQRKPVRGFAEVVFSGLPTVEIARVLVEHILPRRELQGLYHLSARPIDKDRLLRLVASQYRHDPGIESSHEPKLDRSLNSDRLRTALGYRPPEWEHLIAAMHADYSTIYAPLRSAREGTRETP